MFCEERLPVTCKLDRKCSIRADLRSPNVFTALLAPLGFRWPVTYAALSLKMVEVLFTKVDPFHDGSVFIPWIVVCMFPPFLPQPFVKDVVHHRTLSCWYYYQIFQEKVNPLPHFLPPSPSALDLALKGRAKLLSSFFVWVGYREVAHVLCMLSQSARGFWSQYW